MAPHRYGLRFDGRAGQGIHQLELSTRTSRGRRLWSSRFGSSMRGGLRGRSRQACFALERGGSDSNHPSGVAGPSSADRELTERLRQALALIEVRLLDHVVASDTGDTCSFAERGWL